MKAASREGRAGQDRAGQDRAGADSREGRARQGLMQEEAGQGRAGQGRDCSKRTQGRAGQGRAGQGRAGAGNRFAVLLTWSVLSMEATFLSGLAHLLHQDCQNLCLHLPPLSQLHHLQQALQTESRSPQRRRIAW